MTDTKHSQADLREMLMRGGVIPACPLALTPSGKFDDIHQRALTRYYAAAGAVGLAVGVHTTQFAIHDPQVGLYRPVLQLASETLSESAERKLKIAGLVGRTNQAIQEAGVALSLGYDCGLLSLGAFPDADDDDIIAHCESVAAAIPIMGFYLQPAVGGRVLSYDFWRRFVDIESVVAIKIAPFSRYYTLDVVRALADSGRDNEIALYTGNDDNIVIDLLTEFRFGQEQNGTLHFVGGLLGHWAAWTQKAAELLTRCQEARENGAITPELLTLAAQVTDSNAALFDTANAFAGCIAGIHEVLVRQGLMASRRTLDPEENLSPGQMEEIDRVYALYPHLNDDAFVAEHLDEWLS